MPQIYDLIDYWQRHPPLHLLAAGYLGFKPQPARKEGGDADGLFALAPTGTASLEALRGLR